MYDTVDHEEIIPDGEFAQVLEDSDIDSDSDIDMDYDE